MAAEAPALGAQVLRHVLAGLDVRPPGRGATAARHRRLFDIARRHPVWVARLVESHLDAVATLVEAGRTPAPDVLYALWPPCGDLHLDRCGQTVTGSTPLCTGLGLVDRALVAARVPGEGTTVLADVSVADQRTLVIDLTGWHTPALAMTATGSLTVERHPVDDILGPPGWYDARPGYWHAACGAAACWAGATAGMVDRAEESVGDDPHRRVHLGAMRAAVWAMQAVLDRAGEQADAEPGDARAAEHRARAVRHTVERLCTEVLDRSGRALGPRPYVADDAVAQRAADVRLYLRDHRAERELEALGRM